MVFISSVTMTLPARGMIRIPRKRVFITEKRQLQGQIDLFNPYAAGG